MYIYMYVCVLSIFEVTYMYIYIYTYTYIHYKTINILKTNAYKNHQKMPSKNTEPGNDGGYIFVNNSWKHVSIY